MDNIKKQLEELLDGVESDHPVTINIIIYTEKIELTLSSPPRQHHAETKGEKQRHTL